MGAKKVSLLLNVIIGIVSAVLLVLEHKNSCSIESE